MQDSLIFLKESLLKLILEQAIIVIHCCVRSRGFHYIWCNITPIKYKCGCWHSFLVIPSTGSRTHVPDCPQDSCAKINRHCRNSRYPWQQFLTANMLWMWAYIWPSICWLILWDTQKGAKKLCPSIHNIGLCQVWPLIGRFFPLVRCYSHEVHQQIESWTTLPNKHRIAICWRG